MDSQIKTGVEVHNNSATQIKIIPHKTDIALFLEIVTFRPHRRGES